jgi:hypothetical protein
MILIDDDSGIPRESFQVTPYAMSLEWHLLLLVFWAISQRLYFYSLFLKFSTSYSAALKYLGWSPVHGIAYQRKTCLDFVGCD